MFNHPKQQFFLLVFTWSFPCYIHFLTPSLSRGWRPHPAAPSAFPASGWAKLGSVAPVQAGTPGPEHLHSLQFAMSHREGQALSMVCWGEHNSKQIGNDTNTMFRDYRVQMLRNVVNSMAKQTCYTSTALTITPAALLILILIFFPFTEVLDQWPPELQNQHVIPWSFLSLLLIKVLPHNNGKKPHQQRKSQFSRKRRGWEGMRESMKWSLFLRCMAGVIDNIQRHTKT